MAITAEELRIFVRAETKQAVTELNRFRQSTSDTTAHLKKFASQLIGTLGVGYAIKKVTGFLSDSVDAYYKHTGEVNKLAEGYDALKTIIGRTIAESGFNTWLGQLMEGAVRVRNLKDALDDLALDRSLPNTTQIDLIKEQIAEVEAAMKTAEGNLAFAGSAAFGSRGGAKAAQAALDNLKLQKEYWEKELAIKQVLLMVDEGRAGAAERQAAYLKMLAEEYGKTEEGAIEELRNRIAIFESWEQQGTRTKTALRDMRLELEKLIAAYQIGGATQAEFNPLGMLPQTTGVLPSDFNLAGYFNSVPQIDFTEATEGFDLMLASLQEIDKEFGHVTNGEILAAQAAKEFRAQLWQSIGEGALQVGLESLVSTMGQMADAMAYAGENGQSLEEVLQASFTALLNGISQVFLAGAYAAFIRGQLELGLVFLGLAGITAIAGGLSNAQSRRMADSRQSSGSLPSPAGAGTVQTGETVIINYNGDVFTGDERAATTLATVRRAGGNR